MDFPQYLKRCQSRVQDALRLALPKKTLAPTHLHQAMHYAVLNGGKRIRACLVYATGESLGCDWHGLDAVACAVELIHAYSLVHDDLPAMDDSDLRRGEPTCHKAFDEATAILVGDALPMVAFQLLSGADSLRVDAATRVKMVQRLAEASSSQGLVGGQVMDLAAEGKVISLDELETIHRSKTGALIQASVGLGAMAACCENMDYLKALDEYASCMGLAFQVQDDILDVIGDTEALGKPQGHDAALDKNTYPSLLGLDGAKEKAQQLCHDALSALSVIGEDAEPLRCLAEYIVARSY